MTSSSSKEMASVNEIDDFLNGAIVQWLESCLQRPEAFSGYSSLLDGSIIHSVWLQIDPEPQNHPISLTGLDGNALCNARMKNFDYIIRNLKTLYEDELSQTILVLPDCSVLGYNPESRAGLEQMKIVLILLLGAAVQCPNKEIFIARIKELDLQTQHAIVELIKQVTDNHSLVLTQDSIELLSPNEIYNHMLRLTKERDSFFTKWITVVTTETDSQNSGPNNTETNQSNSSFRNCNLSTTDNNHMAVELADLKSKLRKLRQELEEKSEAYLEIKEELDYKKKQFEKLRNESQEWYNEAKRASAYRDEADILRERAERADRFEVEVQRLREKLTDAEFHKTRVEELREENRMLIETKEIIEEQLQRSLKRSENLISLESEIIKYKQKLNELSLDRDADKYKLQELIEENSQLQLVAKNNNLSNNRDASLSEDDCNSGDNSLSEQLTNNAQSRVLKLELENRRLTAALDQLKEKSFHETTTKILELEKDKKKQSIKIEQLEQNCNRLLQQNKELENVFQNALEENKKLQDALNSRQNTHDRLCQEKENERTKVLDLEKHIESLNKDKQRIQTLGESIQRRADDLEHQLEIKRKEIEELEAKSKEIDTLKNKLYENQTKIDLLERENISLSKEIVKLKENLEKKSVLLDESTGKVQTQAKEIQRFVKDLENVTTSNLKIQELEKLNNELISLREIDLETIEMLQKDLVSGTLASKKVKQNLEKLGFNNNDIENSDINVETVVEKLVTNPESFKTVCEVMLNVSKQNNKSDICVLCHRKEIFTVEKDIEFTNEETNRNKDTNSKWKEQCEQLNNVITSLQTANENLQTENAKLNVDIATLNSKINSLNTQHIALQLANSQLAADKDSLVKCLESSKQDQENLLHDQDKLQSFHDELSTEYESLNKEKESLKTEIRDVRNDNRNLKEKCLNLEKTLEEIKHEMISKSSNSNDLATLRAEHSKLTSDFRNLFTTNERYKNEYKNIQQQYKIIRSENSRLKLQNTELNGELNLKVDQCKTLEMENTKEIKNCELLLQANNNLDIDRRKLMDNVSQLLAQYHELLTHSLDDKQHYHDEEKSYTEKLNSLSRQKEKLEIKIMDHYKKTESCVPKKKPFGSSFVKKMKKASSDVMNKLPSRNRRQWNTDSRFTQSQITLGSESGGNDSDNSTEEPISMISSDSNQIQRNVSLRQSLQRKQNENIGNSFSRGGVRSSLQTIKRDEINNSRRNSVHGLEAPDVTGSSLTLGAAGSRRTVYLFDEGQKLPESNSSTISETPTPTQTNNVTSSDNPTTFLMYNKINTTIGSMNSDKTTDEQNLINSTPFNITTANNQNDNNKLLQKKRSENDKSSNWFEYGCI